MCCTGQRCRQVPLATGGLTKSVFWLAAFDEKGMGYLRSAARRLAVLGSYAYGW